MNNTKKFREINEIEKVIIHNSLLKISTKILPVLNRINYKIYITMENKISKINYPSIFLIPSNLTKSVDRLTQNTSINIAGSYFGFIKKGDFYLSLEGTEFLLNLGCFSKRQKIIVNENGEKAILYGNQILKRMVIKVPNELEKNDFLIVLNLNDELIAIGKSHVSYHTYKNLKPNDLVVLNLVDKGYYLRKRQ
ncbi:MAG: PUA domain-containing protein [Promethearchaeota archaeon]